MISARVQNAEDVMSFEDLTSLMQSPLYMQMCWLSIVGSIKDRVKCSELPDLPQALTTLHLEWTEVTSLPRLPVTLITLSAKSCRIRTWPDTLHCPNLRNHNFI